MKQFQFSYANDEALLRKPDKIEPWRKDSTAYITLKPEKDNA